jgi:predicted  nucleic acid-binding Zn-ribbon protein
MQFDAQCPKCGQVYSFTGATADDRPACPECKHKAHVYKDPPPPADSPLYAKPIGENALFDEPKGEA